MLENSILTIYPYWRGLWMFDDERHGLYAEPFVSGSSEILDVLAKDIPNAKDGFTLIFSASPFPGAECVAEHDGEEQGGNWYTVPSLGMRGWLCPALFKYFRTAPRTLYVRAQECTDVAGAASEALKIGAFPVEACVA